MWLDFAIFKNETTNEREKKGVKTNDSTSSHSPDRVERSLTGFSLLRLRMREEMGSINLVVYQQSI